MNSLFCGLGQDIFKKIYTLPTAYDIWNFLELTYSSLSIGNESEQFHMDPREEPNGDLFLEEDGTTTLMEREDEILTLDEETYEDVK
ncbi:hypothetical protein KSP40_PGU003501 [Platanthera guangdongensis]|uniref:Uncharacterized protein n=1 Tax=Platanthera guangdongensis TaxID=2320717 RepID=A0ABR2LCN7_9ASPA